MPDLTPLAISNWLDERQAVEDLSRSFALDLEDDAAAPAIERLGGALDQASSRSPTHLSDALAGAVGRDLHRQVLAGVSAPVRLRLLDWLTAPAVDVPDRVLAALWEDPESPAAQLLQNWLAACQRQALLERLFSADRVRALLHASRLAAAESAA